MPAKLLLSCTLSKLNLSCLFLPAASTTALTNCIIRKCEKMVSKCCWFNDLDDAKTVNGETRTSNNMITYEDDCDQKFEVTDLTLDAKNAENHQNHTGSFIFSY